MSGVPGSSTPGTNVPSAEPGAGGGEKRVVGYRILDDKPPEQKQAEQKARVVARRRSAMDRTYQLIDYAFFVLYGLLGIRLALGALGANENAGFVQFMRAITQLFYGPFVDIVPALDVGNGRFEMAIVICMLVYVLLHVAVRGLLHVLLGTKRAIAS